MSLCASLALFTACEEEFDMAGTGSYDATPARSAAGVYEGTATFKGETETEWQSAKCTVTISEVQDLPYCALLSVKVDGQSEEWTETCNICHTAKGFEVYNFISTKLGYKGTTSRISNDGVMKIEFTKNVRTLVEIVDPFFGAITSEQNVLNDFKIEAQKK